MAHFTDDFLNLEHPSLGLNRKHYEFNAAAIDGSAGFRRINAIKQASTESYANWEKRLRNIYGFNYSKSIVELLSFFLFSEPDTSTYGSLEEDELFSRFRMDSDRRGSTFQSVLKTIEQVKSIYGFSGALILKPVFGQDRSRAIDISELNTPFVTIFNPLNILDWQYDVLDGSLTFVKVLSVDGRSGEETVLVIDRDFITRYRKKGQSFEIVDEQIHPLGFVPFRFHVNETLSSNEIGQSDIQEISKIDLSIINNLFEIEEVLESAGFPIVLKPRLSPGEKSQDKDVAHPKAIWEFDPEHPESKPSKMPSEVREPVEAILEVINHKVMEIHRSSNCTGTSQTNQTASPQSGVSLTRLFQMLNSKLASKSETLEGTQRFIAETVASLIGKSENNDITIARPKKFDVATVEQSIDNVIASKAIVMSATFDREVAKKIAGEILQNANPDTRNQIFDEIEDTQVSPTQANFG